MVAGALLLGEQRDEAAAGARISGGTEDADVGSGGMVISDLPQRTDWTLERNAQMAAKATGVGYDHGLAPARFIASHGWELQQEPTICTSVLLTRTQRRS